MAGNDSQKRIAEIKEKIRELRSKKTSCMSNAKVDFQIMELEDEVAELQQLNAQAR